MSLRSEEMRRQGVRQRQPGSGRPRGVGMTADGCLRRRCTPGWPRPPSRQATAPTICRSLTARPSNWADIARQVRRGL